MSTLPDRIAQFRKMATEDPGNELGHWRLGQALMEAGQYEEAIPSFRRALEISPQFASVFQLLGTCLVKLNRPDEAIKVLKEGFAVADERGNFLPRDEMAKLLVELGEPAPQPRSRQAPTAPGPGDGFQCHSPNCKAGPYARRLAKPPMPDDIGQRIFENVCAECWDFWLRQLSIKVINEMRLDLSTERGQEIYDQIMRETLGLE